MISSPHGYQMSHMSGVMSPSPSQEGKLKNYYAYDMIEKRGQKNIEKIQNDLTKIYVMQGN